MAEQHPIHQPNDGDDIMMVDEQAMVAEPQVAAAPSRSVRKQLNKKMIEALASDKLDEFGDPISSTSKRQRTGEKSTRKIRKVNLLVKPINIDDTDDTDKDDDDYPCLVDEPDSDDDSDEASDDDVVITNIELAGEHPPKQDHPATSSKNRSKQCKRALQASTTDTASKSSRRTTVEEVEDEDSPSRLTLLETEGVISASSGSGIAPNPSKRAGKRSPIYLFYERVDTGPNGEQVADDQYFKCHHGIGLAGHLKNHFPVMYRLYEALKDREEPPTPEEHDIACGKVSMDSPRLEKYVCGLEASSNSIKKAFMRQSEAAWDQAEFEKILAEWMVACDQPFEEVERREFKRLLQYTHRGSKPLHIPGRTTMKTRILQLGKDTIADMGKCLR
ncbi:hypothetical protein HGRIS_012008 [Hohenbuehelia grisea]|uniref:Uncharacterized protein n=1 Tax=Hohenbuehelia grisea TaxID=104357 RepID=A0ABR3IP30_9AGAR